MIVLDVEDYCHHCPYFEPHAENGGYFYVKGKIFDANMNTAVSMSKN